LVSSFRRPGIGVKKGNLRGERKASGVVINLNDRKGRRKQFSTSSRTQEETKSGDCATSKRQLRLGPVDRSQEGPKKSRVDEAKTVGGQKIQEKKEA